MLKDFTKSDLLWNLFYAYDWSQEAINYMYSYLENIAMDIDEINLNTDNLYASLLLMDYYHGLGDWNLWAEEISIALWLIYDTFNTGGLVLAFQDTLTALGFANDSLTYLTGKNPVYTTDYDLILYLNHYTIDDFYDILREFARNDYISAELSTLIIDKMKWYCGEIQFNEDTAVYPEKHIPPKEYVTAEDVYE